MTLTIQFVTMLSMIMMGSVFGAAFDTYHRLFRRSSRHALFVFLNDILFWLFQGLVVFYLLFQINNGEIRLYVFLALLCGFAAYQGLLKSSYLRFLEIIISISVSTYRFTKKMILMLIYRPIRSLVLFTISIAIFIAKGLLTLVKIIYSTLRLLLSTILKILFYPLKMFGLLFYKILPKRVKIFLSKLYNKVNSLIKLLRKQLRRWFK